MVILFESYVFYCLEVRNANISTKNVKVALFKVRVE